MRAHSARAQQYGGEKASGSARSMYGARACLREAPAPPVMASTPRFSRAKNRRAAFRPLFRHVLLRFIFILFRRRRRFDYILFFAFADFVYFPSSFAIFRRRRAAVDTRRHAALLMLMRHYYTR